MIGASIMGLPASSSTVAASAVVAHVVLIVADRLLANDPGVRVTGTGKPAQMRQPLAVGVLSPVLNVRGVLGVITTSFRSLPHVPHVTGQHAMSAAYEVQ